MPSKNFEPLDFEIERIGKLLVDSAYKVHSRLGQGLLEKVYEVCFCYLLEKRGIKYLRQVDIPIVYDEIEFNEGLRLDVLIEDSIICELKALKNVNSL